MSYLKLCALALILAATTSCGDQPYFMETISFDGQKWTENTMPEFKVNFEGDTSSYDVIFTFRTSTDYAYNNLWIYLTTAGPMCSSIGDNAVFLGGKPKSLKLLNLTENGWVKSLEHSSKTNSTTFEVNFAKAPIPLSSNKVLP